MHARAASWIGALRWFVAVIVMLAAGAASAQAPSDANVSPAIQSVSDALTGATVVASSHDDFATYPLIVKRIDQRGGIKGNIASTRTIEGHLDRVVLKVAQANPAAVVAAIEESLSKAGFKPLYSCSGESCGPTFIRASPGFRQHRKWFNVALVAQHYVALRKPDKAGDIYASAQVARSNADAPVYVQLDVVEVQPRVVSAITVNAAEMAQSLEKSGRVALYGLFFATDSARIKPASRETLGEIAKLLHDKPQLKLLVVGHTDSRGSFKYNLKLSRRRAHAVVDALVQNYGIDPDRLKPFGVSYAAPTASNNNPFGRSRNRRVELVIW